MCSLAVKNIDSQSNIFKNLYNFSPNDKALWTNPYIMKDINRDNDKSLKYKNFALMLATFSLLFFSSGVQRKTKKQLELLKEYLDTKQGRYFFDEKNLKVSFYEYASRKVNSFINKAECINNINSLKDLLFMRVMYKTPTTRFIHKKISKCFEFLSRNTIFKSYQNVQKSFNKTYKKFDMLDDYILKHHAKEIVEFNGKRITKGELVEQARDKRSFVRLVVDTFISKYAQDERYAFMEKTTSPLYSEIWNLSFKDFWTKNNKFKRKEMWQTFIAAEKIKVNKTDLTNNIALARNILSYSDAEKKAYISVYIDNLNSIIPANDVVGIDAINRLKWYIKDDSLLKDNMASFSEDLSRLEKHKFKTNFDSEAEQKLLKDKNANIKQIRNMIKEDAPGDIEKMVEIYRKIAPIELSKSGALRSLKKSVNKFDKTVSLEAGELFDKLRDLEIGSAPTDVLTIIFSIVPIIYALCKSKNQEERASILLKSGIPTAGAVAVTLYSTARLVSGTKSLLLGFVSGIVLSGIGEAIHHYRKTKLKQN